MRISKKLVIFVVGFCLPAIMAISSSLGVWFDNRIDEMKHALVEAELTNIQGQIKRDLTQLELFNQIYAIPMMSLESDDYDAFEEAWLESGIAEYFHLFYIQDGQVAPFSPAYEQVNNFDFSNLSSSFLAINQQKTGFVLSGDNGYMVSVIPVSDALSIAIVRNIDKSLLTHYQANNFLANLKLKPGEVANNRFLSQSEPSLAFNVPSLTDETKLHLEVYLGNSMFIDITKDSSLLIYLVWAFSLLLLFIGYLWLRGGVVRPFKQLLAQLAKIDPTAKTYQPIHGDGCSELMAVADQVNGLLARVFQQKERSKTTLEAIVEAVILVDARAKVVYLNPQAERLLKVKCESAIGMAIDQLFKSDRSINQALFTFMKGESDSALVSKVKFDRFSPKIMERSISHLRNSRNQVIGAVIVLRDITQEELLKHQLRRRANYDAVTSLLNRSAFEDRLIAFSRDAQSLALCYFDLEQFKLINDSCGHNAGDAMLKMVAKAIQSSIEGDVLLARLGGDEFGLALKDNGVVEVAQQVKTIIDAVSMQVMEHQGCHYKVGISAGIAVARAPYIVPQELLKDADIACIAAKRKGSNQIHFYDDKDKELTYQRNAPKWAVRIAQAIEHNELLLYYQPIRGISGNSHRKRMEILLRIQEPCGRILPPAQFIAAAERFKLMTEVDKEVIRKTFLWLSMHEELWVDHCLSINLSGNSLGAEGMVDYIVGQLQRFAIPSHCICFEITETSAIQNHHRAMEMLNLLRKQGFSFALDDFGTGFASYGYLRELPVNYVKIDGCFIKTLASNAKDYAIVKSIHDVCRVMGIETVAEFVENQDIIDRLQSIGINYAQGYAIGRPQSLDSYLTCEQVDTRLLA
ncbi:putative bifunctional diguanylate cyclase/phosphodiesterase [Shewanella psychrotolerans]|uniref:putative bifunctional diguanylate cyclase/phosphodiesterase n=1 Tax=Shewanella psychrotolerans TaxID=2864206 RepID=UPI001C65FEDE|nr:EAL domain-containing protein [Shewanella psychrotolerans]QYK01092.1 EAL domain-containing protein [Shewanella psychrotolerans]